MDGGIVYNPYNVVYAYFSSARGCGNVIYNNFTELLYRDQVNHPSANIYIYNNSKNNTLFKIFFFNV